MLSPGFPRVGDANCDSDLDVLVEFEHGRSLLIWFAWNVSSWLSLA